MPRDATPVGPIPRRWPVRGLLVGVAVAGTLVAGVAFALGPERTPALPEPALVCGERSGAWSGDFDTGNLSQYNRRDLAAPDRIRVVGEPRREGSRAARFEVRPGDVASDGNRAEVYTDDKQVFREGEEWCFSWSTMFAKDFPAPDDWAVFAQFKSEGGGSPPLAMGVRSERIFFQSGPDDGVQPWFRGAELAIDRGHWHDWLVRVRFSSEPSRGFVEIWHDGKAYLPRRASRTLYAGYSYLKLGLYRSPKIPSTGVVFHDAMRIERTSASVAR